MESSLTAHVLRRASRRGLTATMALALAVPSTLVPALATPRVAWAGPARTPDDDPNLVEARELYAKGKASYETFQYEKAIEYWTQAYSKLPPDRPGIRNRMVYNIATAQERQYEIDKDVGRLRQAVMQLESWVKNFKAMYKKTPGTTGELERAEARIKELKDKIAAIDRGEDPTAVAESPDVAAGGETGKEVGFESDFTTDPQLLENRRRLAAENETQGLLAAGWTVGGLGILVALAGVGALVGARDTVAGRAGGGATVGVGVLMMGTGGVLLGVGYKKKKAVAAGDYSLVPTFGPHGGGLAVVGRF